MQDSSFAGVETAPLPSIENPRSERRQFILLCSLAAALFAALLAYARTRAFAWDEGFHVMAAKLIASGKRPYLDFAFPQTPLNAYWNAAWIWIFGDSWRLLHSVAAFLVCAAALFMAEFVLKRFPARRWRFPLALATLLLIVLDEGVFEFGAIGQAYALCLLLTVAAFRAAVAAVDRRGPLFAAGAGLLAGAAAASSLLTAPAVPAIALWMLFYNRAGSRAKKFGAFAAAAAIPFLPVLWLFAQAPRPVFFNVLGYQLFYRRVHWEGATGHDLEVFTSWLDSSQALLLGVLAIAGLLYMAKTSGWDRVRRAEFYLAAWMAAAMGLEIGAAHPTFWWYFQLIVPFLALPAAAGLYFAASRLYHPDRPRWPVAVMAALLLLSLGRSLYEDADALTWPDLEAIARKVDQVTPPNGVIWADEQIYFLTGRPMPEGMEFAPAHKLEMPLSQAAMLHILPEPELDRRVKAGAYATISTCDDDKIELLRLDKLYAHKATMSDCTVFWGWK